MKLANKILTTTIDYPGHSAFTVFTVGCNLDCVFCHNRSIPKDHSNHIDHEKMIENLEKRKKFLDHITITGGEPCMHDHELVEFCQKLRQMGYLIKLDTNGLYPNVLKVLLDQHLLEYVAMDLKSNLTNYGQFVPNLLKYHAETTNKLMRDRLTESMNILANSLVLHEYRTTPTKESCSIEDFISIGKDLSLAYKDKKPGGFPVWYIQNTRPVEDAVYEIYSDEVRSQIVTIMNINFPLIDVKLR